MIKTYINEILNEFDQEFESLVIPFPGKSLYVAQGYTRQEDNVIESQNVTIAATSTPDDSSALKLQNIENLAAQISAERYCPHYNPEICLANLLNYILSDKIDLEPTDNFFQLLNEERNVDLHEALTDFDFYLDNPYKKKAEKILSKIEARKNR